jgi:enediyne biosynthesis protein E4
MRLFSFSILISFLIFSCKKEKPLFELLKSEDTGIEFANNIIEKDTANILDTEFIYNGGGVAVGDLNNDGLQDLYFAGNQVTNKLYLNKGNLKFQDITKEANADKYTNQWSSGVNILDINADGLQDIYVCNTMHPKADSLRNNLFVNQGNDKNGTPHFKEMAKEYGLDNASHSSHAQFFDYDNDGDLDCFIGVNFIDTTYPNQFFTITTDGSAVTRDILLKNEYSDELKQPVFKDVSLEAGIVYAGYSHSTLISDFNQDGWQDIYVANDYISNDLVFINNKNGTFTNRAAELFKHISNSAMGSDIGDINNDGLMDMFTTEMLPYDNKRKKLFLNPNNYTTYIYNEQYKYLYQYVRNTLQLNRGLNPQTGFPVFSEISFLSNTQETDWSWTPLFADFDNDGFRDLFVTNGFPKDITDHDFAQYRASNSSLLSKQDLYDLIPEVKIPNFLFKNNGDLTFEDVSTKWGLNIPSFSNGAIYADLDNDGDLEIVVNNIDDKAFVFKNTLKENESEDEKQKNNYLRIKLTGSDYNKSAFGAEVKIFYGNHQQVAQLLSGRGYLSKSENTLHFGLGNSQKVDSIQVKWVGGLTKTVKNINTNQNIEINQNQSIPYLVLNQNFEADFINLNQASFGLDYVHAENDFIDFNFQKTLPHKFSQYGPNLTVGDINGDNLDDIFIGGSGRFDEVFYVQQPNGTFKKKLSNLKTEELKKEEDLGSLLFDADNDGDNDLYLARGSGQFENGSSYYKHLLCINDGKGNFTLDSLSINKLRTNGSAVKATDFDSDGDLDLFIGGRVEARAYPKPDKSFILRNDSQSKDKPKFTDITAQICPELSKIGMISDALWTDFDNDNKIDLILVGEWMPITFLKNKGNKFENITQKSGISDKLGWWNSLSGGDFDNDGDIDYMAGNFGLNTYFKCNSAEPITIYAKDFDNNGLYDPLITCYWRDSTNEKHEYLYHQREDLIKQMVGMKRKFQTFGDYGRASMKDYFTGEELKDALILKANYMQSSFIENLGNGQFKMTALPIQAQFAPLYGMMPIDYDKDGLLDIALVGNDYGLELLQGRADAFYGLVLKNIGKNQFKVVELNESHFFVPKEARALVKVSIQNQKEIYLASQNRDSLKVFNLKNPILKSFRLKKDESKAILTLTNGRKRIQELAWGSTFLSQDSRTVSLDNSIKEITLYNQKNQLTRTLK